MPGGPSPRPVGGRSRESLGHNCTLDLRLAPNVHSDTHTGHDCTLELAPASSVHL